MTTAVSFYIIQNNNYTPQQMLRGVWVFLFFFPENCDSLKNSSFQTQNVTGASLQKKIALAANWLSYFNLSFKDSKNLPIEEEFLTFMAVSS